MRQGDEKRGLAGVELDASCPLYFSKPRREGRRLVPPVKTTSTHQPTMNTFDLSELVSDFLSSLRTWMSAGDQKERDLLL